jgi:hypothetical protein
MLGYVTESADYNLPVDAITRKPLVAFSLNRSIREGYSGPLFEVTGSGEVYEPDLADSVGESVVRIFDQKVRYDYTPTDVVIQGDAIVGHDPTKGYYLNMGGGAFGEVDLSSSIQSDVGVLAVCDPDDDAKRAPLFSASNSTHELCFDIGSAYMRFDNYKITDINQLFGGMDSPDITYSGYSGNFSDIVTIRNASGFSGRSLKRVSIDTIDKVYIGRSSSNNFRGKIFEIMITDFVIPGESVDEIFNDWKTYYSLT